MEHNMIIKNNNLFGLYHKNISDAITQDRSDISFNGFILDMSELGIFPTSGPHQLLNDPDWINRHEEKVYLDALRKVKDKQFKGLVLVDYRGKWHPHFDFSTYETSDGYFTDSDFDENICTSGKLYFEDNNYREDFYNYLYCSKREIVTALDVETELEAYVSQEWNSVCRSFYEATIRSLRKALPNALIGFIDLPRAIYKKSDIVTLGPGIVGYGNRFDEIRGDTYNIAQRINNDLVWLWKQIDVIAPYIKAIRYPVSDKSTPLTGIENTFSTNATYISSNVLEGHRLQALYGTPHIVPVFDHLYSSLPPYSRKPLTEENFKQQLQLPFAAGANAIALTYNGKDDPSGHIQDDYKNEIFTYLPKVSGRPYSGGSRSRPMGGASITGSDIKPSFSAPIQTEAIKQFMPLQIETNSNTSVSGIDRRPVRIYTLWEDNFLSSTGALNRFASWWNSSDGVANLINKLDADYNLGFRRFMFYMPAGNQIDNPGLYSPNQWGPLSSSKKTEIETALSAWIADVPEEIEISVMAGIRFEEDISKLSTHQIDYDRAVPYDLNDNSFHRTYFEENWQHWIDAGISSIIFHDVCADDVIDLYLELLINQSLAGIRTYGYCLPVSASQTIDEELISLSPWVIRYDELILLQGNTEFVFDTELTEVGVLLTPQMGFSAQDVRSMQTNGLVIYAAEGTVADDVLFNSGSSDSEEESAEFVEVQGDRSDPIEGFGVVRHSSVNVAIDGEDIEPPYLDFPLVAVSNSVNGIFVLNSSLTKRDSILVDILNPSFDNTSLPHATIEDTFEWVNSGLPSHLSQTRDSNVIQMGLNLTRTNSSSMSMAPPYQAKYILPCSTDIYDSFNSTVDFEESYSSSNTNLSLPYATAVVYIPELEQVWVGGPGGILSIDVETYNISSISLDNRRTLQIKDIFTRNNKVYVLEQSALYIYDIDTAAVTRDPGLGWRSEVFEFINFSNTNLAVGAEDGIYARKELEDEWTLVKETTSSVDSMISPDAGFAIANKEVFYTTDGLLWTSIGTTSRSINGLVKYRNRIYLATDEGIYEDGGFFYAERVSLRLIDIFNDADESRDVVANDIDADQLQVVVGLDDGRLVTITDSGSSLFESGLDTIHKVIIVGEDVWMFSFNSFKVKSQSQLRRLASGQRL